MLQRLVREGHILINGNPCLLPRHPVKAGDDIAVRFPPPESSQLVARKMHLEILLEDEHLIVINKPAGLVVHPGAGHQDETLVHGLLHHCGEDLSGIGGVQRPGIVHRLDKDTSGCLVIAKTDEAHRHLVDQFKSRDVDKTYLALVWGKPRMHSGKVEAPIGRHPIHRKKMAIQEKGRDAITLWRLAESLPGAALLECRILTGRTHQIRVHLASAGHPVVGDELYGGKQATRGRALGVERQLLHSWKLSFRHPTTGESVNAEAPIPPDFHAFISQAKRT
jgi:23S rRNA pseudouridine1911/1915/1917 synthase